MTTEYEKALAKYYSKLSIFSAPLISWDIFSSQTNEISLFNSIQENWKTRDDFHQIVNKSKKSIIVTNINLEIVFVSENIYEMNGFHSFEILGKSPKIFQGKLTSSQISSKIRIAIDERKPFREVVLNYKKDGSTYLCEIEAYPKFNKKGEFINYIAIERIAS